MRHRYCMIIGLAPFLLVVGLSVVIGGCSSPRSVGVMIGDRQEPDTVLPINRQAPHPMPQRMDTARNLVMIITQRRMSTTTVRERSISIYPGATGRWVFRYPPHFA